MQSVQTQYSNVIPRAELAQEQQQPLHQQYQQPVSQGSPQTTQYGYNALPVAGRDDAYFENH
jgi:hypothetical protein